MANQLTEYLSSREASEFRPHYFYSKDGDFLTYYFREDDCYAVRKDDTLTVYKSMADHEFVGFKLKGVRLLLDKLGEFCLEVRDGKGSIMLSVLVNAAMILTDEVEALPDYHRFLRDTMSVPLNMEEFELV